jgi:hypothetical protein
VQTESRVWHVAGLGRVGWEPWTALLPLVASLLASCESQGPWLWKVLVKALASVRLT